MKNTARRFMFVLVVVSIFAGLSLATSAQEADLDAIKTYLLEKEALLQENTAALKDAANAYYELAAEAEFDYAALWEDHQDEVAPLVNDAKAAWMNASPLYEQVEGIVAGVPSLSEYDVILDAGASGEEDPEGGVPFDLTLEDGRILERPGNLFGLLEATLWSTRPEFSSGVEADLDDSGEIDFGELLPEANMLKAAAEALDMYTAEMVEASEAWQPNESDAFTALVVMVPTMSEYFGSWKESRFIAGDEATRTDFVVISRLSDIQDILSSLQVVYEGVSPLVETVSPEQAEQIGQDLADLKSYVADLYEQEQDGRVFTPEEADFFGSEAQDRATAITGQIAQVAALLEIELAE